MAEWLQDIPAVQQAIFAQGHPYAAPPKAIVSPASGVRVTPSPMAAAKTVASAEGADSPDACVKSVTAVYVFHEPSFSPICT